MDESESEWQPFLSFHFMSLHTSVFQTQNSAFDFLAIELQSLQKSISGAQSFAAPSL